jgi:hypothetical protein
MASATRSAKKERQFGNGRTILRAPALRPAHARGSAMIKRVRIEPISTYLERYRKGEVAHPVTIANGFVYLSGVPPFDPESGEIKPQPFERQCELVLEQLKRRVGKNLLPNAASRRPGPSKTSVPLSSCAITAGIKGTAVLQAYFP